ncbi:MAG: BON domain-containing protein [Chloracidobacterium sp.]|nr:BON domain-containing protein [Chloracidobacterium sp.]
MSVERCLKTDFVSRATRIALIVLGALLAMASANCERRSVTDAAITAAVKSKLAAPDDNGQSDVNVDTRGGVVTLTGAVETQAEKERAERVAGNAEGVTRVINNIMVDTGGEYDGERAGMSASDLEILSKIKTRYVAEGVIGAKVRVVGGVVTLKGAVDDAQTRTRAEYIARATSGVKEVNNLLKLTSSSP